MFGGIIHPDFKTYYKAVALEKEYTNQWNRIKRDTEIWSAKFWTGAKIS